MSIYACPKFTQQPAMWIPLNRVSTRVSLWVPYYGKNTRRALWDLCGRRSRVEFSKLTKLWSFPKRGKNGNYADIVRAALLEDIGSVEVWQDYAATEQCDTRCREALGSSCECSCTGIHHGEQRLRPLERIVGTTTIVQTDYRRVRRLHGV